jgi:hypothetical protein
MEPEELDGSLPEGMSEEELAKLMERISIEDLEKVRTLCESMNVLLRHMNAEASQGRKPKPELIQRLEELGEEFTRFSQELRSRMNDA